MVSLVKEPVIASEDERQALEQIEHLFMQCPVSAIKFITPSGEEVIDLPESALRAIRHVVHVMAQGEAVAVVPVQRELTTQQAADLINVSRQYFVQLLERGEIPFERTGTHRRVKFGALMEYKQKRDRKRVEELDQLTQMSEELGLY